MSNQLQITGGAKVRNLQGVITGTSGVLGALGINVPDGIPQLDGSGKILVSQLPNSVMEYKGTWNVATNTPYLVDGVGNAGDVYIVTGAATGGTTHNFGAGPILFYNGDQAIYDGSLWQRASGSSGTVTSVAMTTPTGLTVTGSPITTSGTLAVSLSSGYTIPTTSFLNTLVPYTGATQDVDLDTHVLNAQALHVKGTAGAGHLGLKHQSAAATGSANESLIYANVDGDLAWKNDNLYLTTLNTHANTADRTYTFPDASGTLALTSDLSAYVTLATPQTITGQKTFTTGIIGTTATFTTALDSGYSLQLKNSALNSNGVGFGVDSTYGNVFTTLKDGVAAARNLTLQNQGGYVSIDESGNFGVNILTPKGGVDIYQSTTASLYLHNSASGVSATDGVRLSLNASNANLRNYESGTLTMTSEGNFSVITASTENFRVNALDGSIYQSYVPNAMLKSVSGVLTAAVAGTDYVAPSALSGYVPTSRTLTINGTTYDLSANRSWSVGSVTSVGLSSATTGVTIGSSPITTSGTITLAIATASSTQQGLLSAADWTTFNSKQNAITNPVTGVGSADSVAYWNSSSNITYDSTFYYSSSNKRLGVNTNTPNATIGANIAIDGGYGLLVKNADNNYNGLGIGIDSTYGNLIASQKLGTASARNVTILNQSGYHSLTEAGSFGLNILTPTASPSGVGSVGIDVYGGSNAAGIGFHNVASGVGNTNGAYIYLTNALSLTLRNLEGTIVSSSLGDFSVITNSTENFRVNASDGSLWQSNITSSLLKTNSSGVIVPAVAGTDYQTPITNPVSGTGTATRLAFWSASNTLSSNANLYWDNTNARLGIGTASNISNALTIYSLAEASQLKVVGGAAGIIFTEALSAQNYVSIVGIATVSNNYITNTTAGDMAIANQTSGKSIFFGIGSTEVMRMTSGGLSITGTKSQLTLTGNSSNGAGITLNNLISGVNRRNWGIFTEQNVDGDFVIKRSDTAGGSAYSGTTILSILNTGAATFSSSVTATNGIFKNPGSSPNNTLFVQTSDYSSGSTGSLLRLGHVATTGNTTAIIQNLTTGGTATGNISFPEGNVGIGTSSPDLTLTVNGAMNLRNSTRAGAFEIDSSGNLWMGTATTAGNLYFETGHSTSGLPSTGTPRMTITGGGNVGIGTTSPGKALEIMSTSEQLRLSWNSSTYSEIRSDSAGGLLINAGGGYIINYIGGSEKMRITSGGNVCIGLTASNLRLGVRGADTGSTNYTFYADNGSSQLFSVRNDGLINLGLATNSPYNYNATFSPRSCVLDAAGQIGYSTSTRESKTNIEQISDVSWLYQLNPVTFNYRKKDDENNYTDEAQDEKWYGLIADEVETINEDLVFYNTKEDGTKQLAGVEYNKLISALVKAIQELKAEINELKNK